MMKEVRNDILYFDGCDTMELAKKYGTPHYVISAKGIRAASKNRATVLQKNIQVRGLRTQPKHSFLWQWLGWWHRKV